MRQVESLKNEQEKTTELEVKVKEVAKERDSLNRQLSQSLPQVSPLVLSLDFPVRPRELGNSTLDSNACPSQLIILLLAT